MAIRNMIVKCFYTDAGPVCQKSRKYVDWKFVVVLNSPIQRHMQSSSSCVIPYRKQSSIEPNDLFEGNISDCRYCILPKPGMVFFTTLFFCHFLRSLFFHFWNSPTHALHLAARKKLQPITFPHFKLVTRENMCTDPKFSNFTTWITPILENWFKNQRQTRFAIAYTSDYLGYTGILKSYWQCPYQLFCRQNARNKSQLGWIVVWIAPYRKDNEERQNHRISITGAQMSSTPANLVIQL